MIATNAVKKMKEITVHAIELKNVMVDAPIEELKKKRSGIERFARNGGWMFPLKSAATLPEAPSEGTIFLAETKLAQEKRTCKYKLGILPTFRRSTQKAVVILVYIFAENMENACIIACKLAVNSSKRANDTEKAALSARKLSLFASGHT